MKLKDIFKTVLSLIILVMLLICAWVLLTSMIKVFGDYPSSVEPTIVVAILSGVVAIIVNAVSKGVERNGSLLLKKKEKLVPAYEEFLRAASSAKTDEEFRGVCATYEAIFAVNASDETYLEFMTIKNSKVPVDLTQFIALLRRELKVGRKTNAAIGRSNRSIKHNSVQR